MQRLQRSSSRPIVGIDIGYARGLWVRCKCDVGQILGSPRITRNILILSGVSLRLHQE